MHFRSLAHNVPHITDVAYLSKKITNRKQTLSELTHFGQNTSQAIAVICCYVMVLN